MFEKSIKNLPNWKIPLIIIGIVIIATGGYFLTGLMNTSSNTAFAQNINVGQEISKADFKGKEDFALRLEQDEDTPFKILEATAKIISASEYQQLTSESSILEEYISVPKVVFQNVSDKTVTGVTLLIVDKAANTKKGYYIREQSIQPGQTFTILPENLVRSEKNPAQNPKFWLDATNKSEVVIRVVAFFEDGSLWANKDQRY